MSGEITTPIFKVPISLYHFLSTLDGTIQGTQDSHFLVEAKDRKEAKKILANSISFWTNYNRFAKQLSEQERKTLRPFRLRDGKIERILECTKRHKTPQEEYICGEPKEDSLNGEFGMCCLSGADSVEGCPYYRN